MPPMKKLLLLLLCMPVLGFAQTENEDEEIPEEAIVKSKSQRYNLHFQTTYIYQYKPTFRASYSGINSLLAKEENQNSLTATLYAGLRLWKGAEAYLNPELAGGSGLSGALGMGGSSNGETFRVGDPAPSLYVGRAYLQQTFVLRKSKYHSAGALEDNANQLAGTEPLHFLRFYIGKYSLGDLFDNNTYSNSPRTQFMNWSLMNNGAWDYAANTRGYTVAFTAELQLDKWNYKLGIAALPEEANGPHLDFYIEEAFSVNAEVSRNITIKNYPGSIRLLGYYNRTNMGSYEQAANKAIAMHTVPDVTLAEEEGNTKIGFGLNFDQQLNNTGGIFCRLGWNDGKNETWCFTEIDQTISLGISANGKKWKRASDNVGIALAANGISKDHRQYLQLGGHGFIVGDGKLNYAPEAIAELYYSFKPLDKGIWLTGDYQFCINPAYNADRGPVHIFSARLHVEL